MLRIGVAEEALGKERCYEAEYGPGTRSVNERVFDVQEVFEWVEVAVKPEPEPRRRR